MEIFQQDYQMSDYHIPVLLNEAVEGLQIENNGVFVDATFGGGGHALKILSRMGFGGKLVGIDRDFEALENDVNDNRLLLIRGNFRYLDKYLRLYEIGKVDGVLVDLGVSSHQFDIPDRGFSYRYAGPLDMRMNKEQTMKASDILNEYDEKELLRVFSEYGEIRNSKTIAKAVVDARSQHKFETTTIFLQTIDPLIRGSRLRYLSQVFQALRIEVNDEMRALEDFLNACIKVIRRGGRLVVISYHSIEDRMVKRFIKTGDVQGRRDVDEFGRTTRPFREVNKKVIVPSESEIEENSRARSAKMRIAEKL